MNYDIMFCMILDFACGKGCMLFWPLYVFMGTKYDFSSTISSACGNHLNVNSDATRLLSPLNSKCEGVCLVPGGRLC